MKKKNQLDEPKSAKATKDTWNLWKLCQTLTPDEIKVLYINRKHSLKYEKDIVKIRTIKREMEILNEAYTIIKRIRNEIY